MIKTRTWAETYTLARAEHAFLLRCEGMTHSEIARRLGNKDKESARYYIHKFARLFNLVNKRLYMTTIARTRPVIGTHKILGDIKEWVYHVNPSKTWRGGNTTESHQPWSFCVQTGESKLDGWYTIVELQALAKYIKESGK